VQGVTSTDKGIGRENVVCFIFGGGFWGGEKKKEQQTAALKQTLRQNQTPDTIWRGSPDHKEGHQVTGGNVLLPTPSSEKTDRQSLKIVPAAKQGAGVKGDCKKPLRESAVELI